jgi:hypothetical protein
MVVSYIFVEETRIPRENHWPATSHWQTLSHNVVSSTPHLSGCKLTTLVVISTDCTGSCKSDYHTITTTTVPKMFREFVWTCCSSLKHVTWIATFQKHLYMEYISLSWSGVVWFFEPLKNPLVQYTIWYFDPGFNIQYGILTPGSIYIQYGILNTKMVVHNTIRGGSICRV